MSAGTLFVVATPLGNLGDLSDRAKDVLCAVPFVAAEDTRRARVLLSHIGAGPRVVSFHAHSTPQRRASIVRELVSGSDVALLTDAGTPAVSDPGADLVAAARAAGARIVGVPGPSAVAVALSISGLPADRYEFLGFPPRKGRERRDLLARVVDSPFTVVLFESPERLVGLLEELAAACGPERSAAVGRELTKLHEECKTGTLMDLAGYYQEHHPRGEVTVVVAGGAGRAVRPPDRDCVAARARDLLSEGLSRRDVAARLAVEFGLSRREAYRQVHR